MVGFDGGIIIIVGPVSGRFGYLDEECISSSLLHLINPIVGLDVEKGVYACNATGVRVVQRNYRVDEVGCRVGGVSRD